jgi:hypothetical protein
MKQDKTWAKTVALSILVVPMILLFSSMAGNKEFRRMKPQWQRNAVELIAIVGTGVGSLFTSVYVYINMTDKK